MRQFSPYEKTQLTKYNISLDQLNTSGEMPVEYITGHVSFNGLDLIVNTDVLIPRVETEELAKRAEQLARRLLKAKPDVQSQANPTLRILDLGTGCGAIAIYLAKSLTTQLPRGFKLEVIGSEISPEALTVAQLNAHRCLVDQPQLQLNFTLSDLWQNLPVTEKFDLVVANLPYIPSARIPVLDASVKSFEPWLALDGGEDGLKLISQMLDEAPLHLTPDGLVLLEVDYTHNIEVFQPWFKYFVITADIDEFLRQRYITCRRR